MRWKGMQRAEDGTRFLVSTMFLVLREEALLTLIFANHDRANRVWREKTRRVFFGVLHREVWQNGVVAFHDFPLVRVSVETNASMRALGFIEISAYLKMSHLALGHSEVGFVHRLA